VAALKVSKAAWISRKRAEARTAGLCITCCKQRPNVGYTVCRSCKESAHERRSRRRAAQRQHAEWQEIITAHERAGDKAQAHHLFDDAAQHYQEALKITAVVSSDRLRLAEKLSSAALLSDNPAVANLWNDRMAGLYLNDSEKAGKAIEALLQMARQCWIDSRTAEGVPICMRAIRIAETRGLDRLHKVAILRLMNHLRALGLFEESTQYLNSLEQIDDTDDLSVQISYYQAKGNAATNRGIVTEAYKNYERALSLTKKDADFYSTISVWAEYGLAAIALGDIERGKTLYEQAFLIARRNHIGWFVPQLCMGYANILACMGQYQDARSYFLEALSSKTHVSHVEERRVAFGIPIALHLNDQEILAKCIRPAAIEPAFRSREPQRIGPIAAAFARLYVARGQRQKAYEILHKASEFVTYVDENIDFPLVVAQYGMLKDIPRTRALLEARLRFPAAQIAESCILLFDAYVDCRMRRTERSRRMAVEAADRFDQLHWYAYADLARSLIPSAHPIASEAEREHKKPLSDSLLTLTEREQQVVELVLKGLTNRAVADKLSISENTVEKHMNSILRRLDIRSRHQLASLVAEPESKVVVEL